MRRPVLVAALAAAALLLAFLASSRVSVIEPAAMVSGLPAPVLGTPTSLPPSPQAPSPQPTREQPHPAREQQFLNRLGGTGVRERYSMVTPENFAQYFAVMSEPELKELARQQPGLPIFPFTPMGSDFSIGEVESTQSLSIVIYSPTVLVRAPIAGSLEFHQNDLRSPGLLTDFGVSAPGGPSVTIFAGVTSGPRPRLVPIPSSLRTDSTRNPPRLIGEAAAGQALAYFKGSDATNGDVYQSAPNRLSFDMYSYRTLPQPLVTDGGTTTIYSVSTYTKRSLADALSWVHTADGRIAVGVAP